MHSTTGQPWCQPAAHSSVSPLSLLALKACCAHLSLKRGCVDLDSRHVMDSVQCTLQNAGYGSGCGKLQDDKSEPETEPESKAEQCGGTEGKTLGFKNGQLMDMQHIFRKHVKPKKQHEIRQLGKVINLVSKQARTDHVVDVGAGLGHLSRLLTFAHGLKVTTVEATGGHAPKANEFDRELKKDIQKKLKRNDASSQQESSTAFKTPTELPSHVICTVQPDITTQDFLNLVLRRDSAAEGSQEEHTSYTNSPPTLSNPPETTSRNMACGHTSSGEDLGHPAESSLYCKLHQKFRSPCLSDREEEDTNSISHSGSKKEAPSMKVDGALISNEISSTKKINSHWEFEQKANGIVAQREEKSANTHLDVSESPAILQKEDGVVMCDSEKVSLCSGESSAKVSKYDTENQNGVINNRDQNYFSDNDQPFTTSKSKYGLISESQTTAETKRVQNLEMYQNLSDCDESESQNETNMQQNQSKTCCNMTKDGRRSTDTRASSVHERNTEMAVDAEAEDKTHKLVLAGLHACGDLTATLLRVLVNCPAVSALVTVACCYMKLSAYSSACDDQSCERGYPMSQFVRSLPAHPLTYEARELSCHFADAYAQRLMDNPPHLKIHSYRAAVQYMVTQTRDDFPHGVIRLVVKRGAEMPFLQYAKVCLQRLGIDPSEVPDSVMTAAQSMTADWRRVVAFYTLRLSLAPLVETALLLDRMMFLYEHGIPSILLPVFDSALSPRNFALLACKPSTS
ncbi:uncharacterized protein [Littorina saxatilis]|uniref:uncharacterized protein isoform X1 n=1 Tax=Littorina saxatilis TaxID=31220 RepID=UPI0038B6AF37